MRLKRLFLDTQRGVIPVEVDPRFTDCNHLRPGDLLSDIAQDLFIELRGAVRVQSRGDLDILVPRSKLLRRPPADWLEADNQHVADSGLERALQHEISIIVKGIEVDVAVRIYQAHLLHRNTLGEVSWLVRVQVTHQCELVPQELGRNDIDDW